MWALKLIGRTDAGGTAALGAYAGCLRVGRSDGLCTDAGSLNVRRLDGERQTAGWVAGITAG